MTMNQDRILSAILRAIAGGVAYGLLIHAGGITLFIGVGLLIIALEERKQWDRFNSQN